MCVKLSHPTTGKSMKVNAFLDSCANRDVVSWKVVEFLDLPTRVEEMIVTTLDSQKIGDRTLVHITMESLASDYDVDITAAIVGNILAGKDEVPPSRRDLSEYSHLKNLPFFDAGDDEIHMLIGSGHVNAWFGGECRFGTPENLVGMNTRLGWTIMGPSNKKSDASCINSIAIDFISCAKETDKIFYHDFPLISGDNKVASVEGREALRQLEEGLEFSEEETRYGSVVPWRGGRESAAEILNSLNSREMAIRRLKGMIARFNRDPERKRRVFDEMKKLEESGYVDFVDESTAAPVDPNYPVWHLPVHVVEKDIPGRGRKTRICHDARASVGNQCPNELMLEAPDFIEDSRRFILRAMAFRILFTTDIAACFYRVLVDKRDVNVFRYFWFDNEQMTEFSMRRFNSHIFGSRASSAVSSFVLRHHADKIEGKYGPVVADIIRSLRYVDDMFGGGDEVPEVRKTRMDLDDAMAEGGFKLSKYKSNRPEVLDRPSSDESKPLGEAKDDETKILGVSWKPSTDTFTFEFQPEVVNRIVKTARDLVSVSASLYDPLGWAAPFILIGRRFLQQATVVSRQWDAPLPEKLAADFRKWQLSIPLLSNLSIRRWWNTESTRDVAEEDLHIFSDACANGFGVVSYRRVVGTSGDTHVQILTARSHVVPINAAKASHHGSIPRLELTAAVKAVEVKQFIESSIRQPIRRVYLWTDSECVLRQIQNTTTSYDQFTGNRLAKIHAASEIVQWNLVPGPWNPGDLASRGIKAEETEKWRYFHQGPAFLWKPEAEWPKQPTPSIQVNKSSFFATQVTNLPAPEEEEDFILSIASKTGNWSKKIRIIACVIKGARRWLARSKRRHRTRASENNVEDPQLLAADFQDARKRLIRSIQRRHFGPEIESLEEQRIDAPCIRREGSCKISSIAKLNPFVAEDGIMRIGSRLSNASLATEKKFPVILPKKDDNIEALIRYTHRMEFHSGQKAVLQGVSHQTRYKKTMVLSIETVYLKNDNFFLKLRSSDFVYNKKMFQKPPRSPQTCLETFVRIFLCYFKSTVIDRFVFL